MASVVKMETLIFRQRAEAMHFYVLSQKSICWQSKCDSCIQRNAKIDNYCTI